MARGKRSLPEIEPGEVSIAVSAGSGNYQGFARKRVLAGVYVQAASKF